MNLLWPIWLLHDASGYVGGFSLVVLSWCWHHASALLFAVHWFFADCIRLLLPVLYCIRLLLQHCVISLKLTLQLLYTQLALHIVFCESYIIFNVILSIERDKNHCYSAPIQSHQQLIMLVWYRCSKHLVHKHTWMCILQNIRCISEATVETTATEQEIDCVYPFLVEFGVYYVHTCKYFVKTCVCILKQAYSLLSNSELLT